LNKITQYLTFREFFFAEVIFGTGVIYTEPFSGLIHIRS